MLQNERLLAKIGFNTAENEPSSQVARFFEESAQVCPKGGCDKDALLREVFDLTEKADATNLLFIRAGAPWGARWALFAAKMHLFFEICQTLNFCEIFEGSFSAVSRPTLASKFSFCSIFQSLQDLRTFLFGIPTSPPVQTQISAPWGARSHCC